MSVQIAIEDQLALSGKWPYGFLDIEYNRMHLLRRILVPPIQVLSTEGAPVVAINDTIHINHGYNLKNKMFAKYASFWCGAA